MLKPSGGRLSLEMSVTFTPALLVTCNSIKNFCTPGVGLGFKTEKRNNNNNKMVTIVRTSLFICSFFLSFFAVVRIGLYVVSSLVTIVMKSFCPRKSTRTSNSNSKSKSEKERKGAREPESKSKNTSKSKNKKSKSERAGPQDSKITQQEKSRKNKQTRQEQEQEQKNKRTKEQ